MTLRKRIAFTVPAKPDLRDSVSHIQWAESLGIPDVWFSDAGAPDTLTQIAAIAHETSNVRVGVAVTPVYTRTPAVLAASAYVLEQLLPGRFVLGLGTSSQTIMGRWNGVAIEKPLARMRETTELVRTMLRGEKSSFDGKTVQSHGYRQPTLASPPPIYLAALRPRMIELAAEIGDGVIFNLWPRGALGKMMKHLHVGAERGGRDPANIEVVNRAMALCTEDKAHGRDVFRRAFAPYYATPVYNEFLAWSGYADAAADIASGWAEKDRAKTSGALSDDLIDEIAVIGDETEIRQRIAEDAAAGIDTQIIAPLPGSPEEVRRTYLAFSAEHFSIDSAA